MGRLPSKDAEAMKVIAAAMASSESATRLEGTRAFSFLGRDAISLMDSALKLIRDPSRSVRSYIMDGVISCPCEMNFDQTRQVLELANDSEDLVREKVMVFIGAANLATLKGAVNLMPGDTRPLFIKGLSYLEGCPGNIQVLFDSFIEESSIEATFALASLQRMARAGTLTTIPSYVGDSYVAGAALLNIRRIVGRASRQRPSRPLGT